MIINLDNFRIIKSILENLLSEYELQLTEPTLKFNGDHAYLLLCFHVE